MNIFSLEIEKFTLLSLTHSRGKITRNEDENEKSAPKNCAASKIKSNDAKKNESMECSKRKAQRNEQPMKSA